MSREQNVQLWSAMIGHEYHPIAEKYWTGLRCCCDLEVADSCFQHQEFNVSMADTDSMTQARRSKVNRTRFDPSQF
jgi:hypothetical protein